MTALDIALAYHRAWTGHDFEAAMQYVADDIVCLAPAGPIEGAEGFREFMEPFSKILLEAALVASYGDESTALLMYDTRTVPVASAPGAELLTVEDGRITHLRIIFDRLPFAEARAADAP
ncbi:nuclear transport factor 2 family protein [Kribbella italica]|uniref:Ketosteroid isomerase-like protein n=1 Tax=Kribbella italica TaxID=1540520 RepID=A0A7W9MS50_9ACTN|nr:nuclear transport factor 2 family protein [Kribbella italica]MBB5834224.1 ketosteroid isomerase-like protein [Kribbella italica]